VSATTADPVAGGWDVVVVGAGLAGLCAGCRAAELGLSVLVVEQGPEGDYDCNSRLSGGVLVVGGRSAGDGPDELAAALRRTCGEAMVPALRDLLADDAGRVVAWLVDHGADLVELEFQPGQVFRQVLGPTGLGSPGRRWRGTGADLLLRRLSADATARGATVRYGHRADRLVVDDGRVTGVGVVGPTGTSTASSRAVVLADGGFQANRRLVGRHIAPDPDGLFLRAASTGQGWGLAAAEAAGAQLVNCNSFYGHLVSADVVHDDRLWPYPILDPLVDAGIVVDRHGRRFTDEGLGGVDVTNKLARRPDPFGFVVCDDNAWRGPATHMRYPPPIDPWLERLGGTVVRADSVEALAAAIGADQLVATVAEGGGPDRTAPAGAPRRTAPAGAPRRTAPAGQAIYAGPRRTAPPAIDTPPFVAIPVVPGITFTMGGPLVDAGARVISVDGDPIAGLYAVGASCGGFDGGDDVGYAGGLMKAAVTGVAAAEHIHRSVVAV